MKFETGDINKKIANFLLTYRNTIHCTTNETPAKLFLGRNLRTRLDFLKPDVKNTVTHSQMKTAFSSEKRREREFQIGQSVITRDYRNKDKWIPGVIQDRTGPLMYKVDIGSTSWRRHADQLRGSKISLNREPQSDIEQTQTDVPTEQTSNDQSQGNTPLKQSAPVVVSTPKSTQDALHTKHSAGSENPVETERRYPSRIRKPPERLEL